MKPIAKFDVVALNARDPWALAEFYASILGWEINLERSDDTWVRLRGDGGATIAFQADPAHVPPEWPSDTDQLQAHLDFYVDDLDAAEGQALAVGARKTEVQPDPSGFRVFLDPAGHPFCLVGVDD